MTMRLRFSIVGGKLGIFPVDGRLLSTTPPLAFQRARGFLFALVLFICYIVQYPPRTGKLQADCRTLRNLSAWPHRSGDKEAKATESCVGRRSRECQSVAISLRRLSGQGWCPADRNQRTTAANIERSQDKTGQRRPATQWATHRKVNDSTRWTTQKNDLCFGLTERFALGPLDQSKATEPNIPTRQPVGGPIWCRCVSYSANDLLLVGFNRQSAARHALCHPEMLKQCSSMNKRGAA